MPTDAMFYGLLAVVIAGAVMNRQRKWVVNALDIREPLIVGSGILVLASRDTLTALAGGSGSAWVVLGLALSAFGFYEWQR